MFVAQAAISHPENAKAILLLAAIVAVALWRSLLRLVIAVIVVAVVVVVGSGVMALLQAHQP